MSLIYKDFRLNFIGLDREVGAGKSAAVAVPGGRAWLCPDRGTGALKPYFDEIHFKMYDEPWWSHHALRDRLAQKPHVQGRVYAGCAGMVNLDYIAATKAPGAVLFDINPLQTLFWNGLIAEIAAQPDNRKLGTELPRFTEELYRRIVALHGADVIRDMDPPEGRGRGWGSPQAPYRWMRYDDVENWMRGMFEKAERGRNWLGDPVKYAHVHRLCKHDAVAAVTLDICDEAACARVGEALRAARYFKGSDAAGFESTASVGAGVGLLYRSNVAYYLKWSAQDKAARMAGYRAWLEQHPGDTDPSAGAPVDYTQRLVKGDAYKAAHGNLRAWFNREGGHMIAADTTSGGGGHASFRPRLRAVKGPDIVAP